MTCPYQEPTIQQCLTCSLPDCAYPDDDDTKLDRLDYYHQWYVAHRQQHLDSVHAYQHKKAALRRQSENGAEK